MTRSWNAESLARFLHDETERQACVRDPGRTKVTRWEDLSDRERAFQTSVASETVMAMVADGVLSREREGESDNLSWSVSEGAVLLDEEDEFELEEVESTAPVIVNVYNSSYSTPGVGVLDDEQLQEVTKQLIEGFWNRLRGEM